MHEIIFRGMWWWDKRQPAPRGSLNRVDFDFLPFSEKRIAVSVLCNDGISLWTNRVEPSRPSNSDVDTNVGIRGYRAADWQREATFAAPFLEPFHVAAADGVYFFVTDESGEVYAAEKESDRWKTRVVWKNANRPIRAMLVESDGVTAYVFGKDFYLKLGRDKEPKPCRDVTHGSKEIGEPTRTVYECGRVLNKKGELTAPDKNGEIHIQDTMKAPVKAGME